MDPIIEEQLFHLYEYRVVRTMLSSLSDMTDKEFAVLGQVKYKDRWRFMLLRGSIDEILAHHNYQGIEDISAIIRRTVPKEKDYGVNFRVGAAMLAMQGITDGLNANPKTTKEFKFRRTLERQRHTLGYIYRIIHDHLIYQTTNIVLYGQNAKASEPEHFNTHYHARDIDLTPIDEVSRRLESLFNTKND